MIPSPADDRPATDAAGPGAARAGRRDGRRTRRWTRLLAAIAAIVALAAIPMDAIASDDHGHGAPVAVPIQLAPRGQARADGIEAVAVAAPGRRCPVRP